MTAVATRNNAVEIARVCATTWEQIRRNHPEVPPVEVTLGTGSEKGKLVKWGHFHAGAWVRDGESVPELLIGSEGLRRGAVEVLGTLLHEAAHGIAMTRGIKDTSRQGRFHNAKFKTIAEEVGLSVTQDPPNGWALTQIPETTQRRYSGQLRALKNVLTTYRREFVRPARVSEGTSGKRITMECACGRKFQLSRSVAELGPIWCGVCGDEFTGDDE